MGEGCCGGGDKATSTPPVPGLQTNGVKAQANGTHTPPVSHKQAAAELQNFINKRIQLFESYHEREKERVAAAREQSAELQITLPDGSTKAAVKGVTTPLDIANQLSKSLAKKVVVADVDGGKWDLFRPLERDCRMQLFTFDDAKGKDAFWHSSSHVLGEALEACFGVLLTIGPSIEEGFYYDCSMSGRSLTDAERPMLETKIKQIVKERQQFQRVEVSRDEAMSMFQENPFKIEILSNLPEEATITLYRCGQMVDLCRGPHVPNTGVLKEMTPGALTGAFWRGDATKQALQRVYGVSFPSKELMEDYKHRMEEAKRRDHRNVGVQQQLFFFNPISPGSCFFLPAGARIYNTLIQFIKDKYWEYEYEEVVTPNIYNFELWKQSGHAAHYKENMFLIDVEKQEYGLKPMNCPGHCVMFANTRRSYRELPIRMADFGVLHRNEYSGALHGLTRVRRFQQDDAHIFCRRDQVMGEVASVLRMLDEVYAVFGLSYTCALSTRPDKFLGEPAMWDQAEQGLKDALASVDKKWELNEGDGAFYGPKIDITVFDALRRKFQCATVQLDFQLPIRFNLQYNSEAQGKDVGMERPVIIHRAILGSVERMFAILTEHFAGKWPLWLSPRQVCVIPISISSQEYASEVRQALRAARVQVDVDNADKTMQKKVFEAQVAQYNYILVVGEKEKAEKLVNVRTRDQQRHGMHALPDVIAQLCKERDGRHLTSTFGEHLQQGASLKPEAATDATAAQAAATSFNVNEETRAVAAAAGQQ